jgi:hypothetical protein
MTKFNADNIAGFHPNQSDAEREARTGEKPKTLADRSRKNTPEARAAETKRFAGTIDMTPTWEEILPTWLTVVRDASVTGQDAALIELTRMAKLADLYVASQKARPSTVGPDGANTRTSIAPNAERESVRATHHVRNEQLSIKSTITPETVYFNHYPGQVAGDAQLHVTVLQGTTGRGIFLHEADALLVRDFLNEFYPVAPRPTGRIKS